MALAALPGSWRRLAAVVIATLPVFAGCLTKKPDVPGVGPVSMTYTVPLTIESRFREDLNVYVVHDGIASRLVRISSASNSKHVIPKHMIGALGEISLLLEPLGARSGMAERVQSPRVRVLPGQGLVWTLETNLSRSFLQVVSLAPVSGDSIR